jgi:TPR repeat protein
MLKSTLTNIKQYFEELIKDCRKQDTEEAYLTLGFLYQHGYGIKKIKSRAIEHYLFAAEKGSIDAQYNLGYIYHHIMDNKFSHHESLKVNSEAAENHHNTDKQFNFRDSVQFYARPVTEHCEICNQPESVESNAKADQTTDRKYNDLKFVKSNTKAVKKHCEHVKSDTEAVKDCHATEFRFNFRESVKFYIEAVKFYTLAAEKGQTYAQSGLAYLHLKGLRVDMDYSKAHFWYSKAAKNRNIEAQISLARMFRMGQGVAQDIAEAIIWYRRAAKEGSTVAQNCLDSLCAGEGSNNAEETPDNNDKPPNVLTKKGLTSKLKTDVSNIKHSVDTKNLEKLATHALFGDAHAMFLIGMKYYDGSDFDKDSDVAFK